MYTVLLLICFLIALPSDKPMVQGTTQDLFQEENWVGLTQVTTD